jgi:hypothetical protein
MRSPPSLRTLIPVVLLFTAGCIVRIQTIDVAEVKPARDVQVQSPVKAHLADGSVVVFSSGIQIDGDRIHGVGQRYDLRLQPQSTLTSLDLSHVIGMESFRNRIDVPASVFLTVGATALGALAASTAAVAIFGSCPTFYTEEGGGWVLEAEGFSYSIAPLLESRDLDRLGARPSSDGRFVLEVRNEALETHFLNHLELLEVVHESGEIVVPDAASLPLATARLVVPASATDRDRRDVLPMIASRDDDAFASSPRRLEAASLQNMRDGIDLVFPPVPGADSVALLLRVRNSLLTTVLLYDVMLGGAGASALDWLGRDLDGVGGVLELGQWYRRHMGLRVLVRDGRDYRQVTRISDTGPIAWKEIGVVVPVLERDSIRVRLDFVVDAWRIDHVALGAEVRRPESRVHAPSRIVNAAGGDEPEALDAVREPDEIYLETTPGQRFLLHFDVGGESRSPGRTLLLASQGYYTEWIRPNWLRESDNKRFQPSDAMLLDAVRRWRDRQPGFEAEFFATKIPVR